jgi:hypothetical protein
MVGKQVRHLEQPLGSPLVNRSTRRQGVTELGRNYVEHCRDVWPPRYSDKCWGKWVRPVSRGEFASAHRQPSASHYDELCTQPIVDAAAMADAQAEFLLALGIRKIDLFGLSKLPACRGANANIEQVVRG